MAIRAIANRLPLYRNLYASSSSSSSSISSPLRIACSPRHHPVFRCQSTAPSNAKIESVIELKEKETEKSSNGWKIKMLYDGDCPLCMREDLDAKGIDCSMEDAIFNSISARCDMFDSNKCVDMLRERNKTYGAIKFVDISSDDYSPAENQGLDYETVMGRIHAILSDGTVVSNVEAFRRLYEEVGLGWVYAITKYEPIATIASSVYSIWAKYRLQITGRPPLDDILEARKKKVGEACTDDKVCKM